MSSSNLKNKLIEVKYDLDDFYNKVYNKATTGKDTINKNYEVALKQLDDELGDFKKKKGKYDEEIYPDWELLNKKLDIELKKSY